MSIMKPSLKPTGLTMSNLNPLKRCQYVTSSTPLVTSKSEIRGVYAVAQQFYFKMALRRSIVTSNEFFKCEFYPPSHLLGLFRKSRPALRVKCEQDQVLFNDRFLDFGSTNKRLQGSVKNMDMMSYSFKRIEVRRLMREKFWDSYQRGKGCDGLYVFNVRLLPKTASEWIQFNQHILQAIEKVTSTDFNKKIQNDNSRVDWRKLLKVLEKNDMCKPEWFDQVAALYSKKSTKRKSSTSKATQMVQLPKRKPTW